MIVTASAVASELRKLADALDVSPETEVVSPNIYFSCSYLGSKSKEVFLSLARLLPHPLKKEAKKDEMWIGYESDSLRVQAYIERSIICELVEPAKPAVYRCEPLLSDDEEAALEAK